MDHKSNFDASQATSDRPRAEQPDPSFEPRTYKIHPGIRDFVREFGLFWQDFIDAAWKLDKAIMVLTFVLWTLFHGVSLLADASGPKVAPDSQTPPPIARQEPSPAPISETPPQPQPLQPLETINKPPQDQKPTKHAHGIVVSPRQQESPEQKVAANSFSWSRPGECNPKLFPRVDRIALVEVRCQEGRWQKRYL